MQTKIFWGDLLRQVRTERRITQEELAKVLHISRQDYSNMETGRVHPTPEIIVILSNIYDLDLIDYAMECMPVEYIEEQHAFRYQISSAARDRKPDRRRKKCISFRNQTGMDPASLVD